MVTLEIMWQVPHLKNKYYWLTHLFIIVFVKGMLYRSHVSSWLSPVFWAESSIAAWCQLVPHLLVLHLAKKEYNNWHFLATFSYVKFSITSYQIFVLPFLLLKNNGEEKRITCCRTWVLIVSSVKLVSVWILIFTTVVCTLSEQYKI